MHEISLVRTIFRTLEEQFPPEELGRITAVLLKIGPLANVEPVLLHNAFDAVVQEEETRFSGASLRIRLLPVLVQCDACGAVTEVLNYRFVCADCGKPSGNVVQGNELMIEGVELA
ncbi:MAG: hydrogenase maturation nickel metallochaperone HypA [Saprospiraceae bacterium]|nr:hydrogenase maturation nickel metallochaperone HypA [Saprospiraceae bacterium]